MACNASGVAISAAREGDAMTETPGWREDPFREHQERFFNESGEPTRFVRTDGVYTLSPHVEMRSPTDSTDAPPAADVAINGPSADDSERADLSAASTDLHELGGADPGQDNGNPMGQSIAATTYHALSSPGSPAPPDSGIQPSRKPRRKRSRLEVVAFSLVALLLVGAGVLAFQQHSVAEKWMHDDQQEVQHNAELGTALRQSHARVDTLNRQMSGLLAKTVLDAAAIAGDLTPCVVDVNTVANDLRQIVTYNAQPSSSLADGTAAQQVCAQAQAWNQHLQHDFSGG